MANVVQPPLLMRQIRFSFRQLRKAPGFSLVAILTLAIGIGASTVVFTIVNSVLLQPLRFRESGQLAVAWERVKFLGPIGEKLGPNPRHVDLWDKRSRLFDGFSLVSQGIGGLSLGSDHPVPISTIAASPDFLKILGVRPILGRGFTFDEGKRLDSIAIISYQLWQSRFNRDPAILGRTFRLDGSPKEIIGVLPERFYFPRRNVFSSSSSAKESAGTPEAALILPMVLNPEEFGWQGNYGNVLAVTRIKPGVTLKQAQAELNVLEHEVERSIPANKRDFSPDALTATLQPMREAIVHDSQRGIWLLTAAVGALMLIACLNLANAQLGRALSRQRETAVRSALGASSWNLLVHGLTESLLLSIAGGAAGLLLAVNALQFIRSSASLNLARKSEIAIDPVVLGFAFLLIAGSGLLAGILPALQSMRANPQLALQQGNSRAGISRGTMRLRSWLIGLQVFGCTVLLLVTALFGGNLAELLAEDRGFDTDRVAVAEVDPSTYRAKTRTPFLKAVLSQLRAVPGISSVGLISAMPLEGQSWIDDLNPVGRPPGRQAPIANLRWVSPGYFETMRMKLVAGRFLNDADGPRNNAVISETAARLAWPGENALGHKFNNNGADYTVVGIAADALVNTLKAPPISMIYAPLDHGRFRNAYFMVRTEGDPAAMLGSIRQAIWKQDPNLNIVRVKTLDRQVDDSLAHERFQTFVLAGFGMAALFLAMLGIYGVLSYAVASRRNEIGIRMALGADKQSIYAMTMRQTVTPLVTGFAGGWIMSIFVSRYVAAELYGVQRIDARTTLLVAALFVTAAALASYLPARRAASIEPMDALRVE